MDAKSVKASSLQQESESSGFWDDTQKAQKVMQEISSLKEWSVDWEKSNKAVSDAEAMLEIAEDSKDETLESEIVDEIKPTV